MNDKTLNDTLTELRFEQPAPFFEDVVMARLERHRRNGIKPLAVAAIAICGVFIGLSFVMPDFSPLRVNAVAEPQFTEADVFNFALTGKLPLDQSKSRFIELTPDGSVIALSPDSQRARYHLVGTFYRLANADRLSINRFDSLLRSMALQLSSDELNSPIIHIGLRSLLLGMNNELAAEMTKLTSGIFHFGQMSDSLTDLFRSKLLERVRQVEDSLIASISDSLESRPLSTSRTTTGGLTEPPHAHTSQPLHHLGDSIPTELQNQQVSSLDRQQVTRFSIS